MAKTTNDSFFVKDDDETEITTEDNINILSAKCRWEGDTDEREWEEEEYSRTTNKVTGVDRDDSGTLDLDNDPPGSEWYPEGYIMLFNHFTVPEYPPNDQDPVLGFSWSAYDPNGSLFDSGSTDDDKFNRDDPYAETYWGTTLPPDDSRHYSAAWSRDIDRGDDMMDVEGTGHVDWTLGWTNYPDEPVEVWMRTTFERVKTHTEKIKTKNPSVSGDVSASYDQKLDDNEWSPWVTLNGLSEGTNKFKHHISGSGEAYFEYTYDWEFADPTPIYFKRVHVNGNTYDLPLVDPNDNALEHSSLRYYVNEEVVAADLVDPSDPNASPFRVYTPQHGILAWHEKYS